MLKSGSSVGRSLYAQPSNGHNVRTFLSRSITHETKRCYKNCQAVSW